MMIARVLAMTVLLTACARSAPVVPGATHRRSVTIAAPAEELLDVTIPLRLDAAEVATGVRVTDDAGNVLALDLNESADGLVWVRVPRLNATEVLWIHFGVPSDDSMDAWSDNHVAVWHLNDLSDATGNGHTGINHETTATTGVASGARFFNGTSSFIEVADHVAFREPDDLTLSVWSYREGPTTLQWDGLITRARSTGQNNSYYLGVFSDDYVASVQDTVNNRLTGSSVESQRWTFVALTWDRETIRLYVDGVEDGAMSFSGDVQDSDRPVVLGADWESAGTLVTDCFHGRIDEARFENVARSQAWLAFQRAVIAGDAVTLGALEAL